MIADHKTAFIAAVRRSFLPPTEKRELIAAANVEKDYQALWTRFNDRLIDWLVKKQAQQDECNKKLDDEISRYTAEYEKEKTVLDRELKETLDKMGETNGATRRRVWAQYQVRIRRLQSRLVGEVRTTSTTVLHDVVLATVPIGREE